jgi:integrase
MPGGPFTSPPCSRCGSSDDYFTAGLCARCHLFAPQRVDSCRHCLAWGATRHDKWLCGGCRGDVRRRPGTCASCHRSVPVNHRSICRLCWRNASGARGPRGAFDPITPNRNGQQLFFAGMTKLGTVQRPRETEMVLVLPRPVTHRQLVLFPIEPDLRCGIERLPAPRAPELATALEAFARRYALDEGVMGPRHLYRVVTGIRVLLGLQDTPGAPITTTEAQRLRQVGLLVRPVCVVLAAAGWLEDDRRPAIESWFERQIDPLPEAMRAELRVWSEVMLRGSTSYPRRRPRSETTIRLYLRWALPILTTWAEAGHESLREISREDVLEALPREGLPRSNAARSLRSIFGLLKARKLIFANPMARMRTWVSTSKEPLPADRPALREALSSSDPARAALAALAAFHGLRSGEIRSLKLTDLRDGRLLVGDRSVVLAEPALMRLRDYLEHRRERWPSSTNGYLFVSRRTARRHEPVSPRWVFLAVDVPGGVDALRQDRILDEAQASDGDTRLLCDLFGLSVPAATRYSLTIDHPDLVSEGGP